MKFDYVYSAVGEFGPYQIRLLLTTGFASLYCGLLFVNSVFVLGIPEHRCAIPGLENDTYKVMGNSHLQLINQTIPPSTDPDHKYDQCHVIKTSRDGQQVLEKCSRWVYDDSVFESTLAAKLNLVCDRAILKSNAQMLFFGGLLTGSFLTGLLSDRYGRKRTMCCSSVVLLGITLGVALTPSVLVYCVLIFCVGFFAVGTFMPAFVMGMEFVGPSKRRIAGMIGSFYWVTGNLILAALGYLIRDWQTLQLVCAAPGALILLYWVLLPESPRWLYTQGRFKESEAIVRRIAKVNKKTLSDGFLEKVFQGEVMDGQQETQDRIWHVFTNKELAIRTLIMFFNWLVVCLAYYGLALNSGDIGGDRYLNFFLQAVMDLPASILVLFLIDRTGRKPMLVTSMVVGGVGCLATIFTIVYGGEDYQTLTTVLAMLGKVGASAGFSTVYIYSAELFPTSVRNAGMGSSSCMARVGGMIAPYIADLDRLVGGDFGKALPQAVFGSLSLIAGIAAIYLPETLNQNLPETIEDGKQLYRKGQERNDKEYRINYAFDDSEMKTHL